MSKGFIGVEGNQGMRSVTLVLCFFLIFLAACSSFAPRQAPGNGVQTIITNANEFRDIYFPYQTSTVDGRPVIQQRPTPESVRASVANPNADLYELFRLQMTVANTGRADALAAIYITGYDPNLFVVHPLGPFVRNGEPRSCWQWMVNVNNGEYAGYAACVREEDVFGLGVTWGDDRSVRADGLNVNANDYLNRLLSWMRDEPTNFEDPTGLFSSLNFNCNAGGNPVTSSGVRIGGVSSGCQISFGVPDRFLNRPSRGSLTLAQYAAGMRNCANGCTLVPSPLLPEQYIGGNTEWTPGGEMMNIDFGVWVDRNRWPENYNDHNQLFQVTTCSLYTTYITPSVCIDPTPGQNVDSKPCVAGRIDLERHQGAPLRISRIDQVSQGPRVMFTFHVEDTMGGRLFYPGAIDFCSPASPDVLSREFRDMAVVVDARILGSSEGLDCRDGLIRLQNGRGQITCSYDLNPLSMSVGAFQTALNVEIAYLYRTQQTIHSSIHRY